MCNITSYQCRKCKFTWKLRSLDSHHHKLSISSRRCAGCKKASQGNSWPRCRHCNEIYWCPEGETMVAGTVECDEGECPYCEEDRVREEKEKSLLRRAWRDVKKSS